MSLIRRSSKTILQPVGDELLVHDTDRDETFALAGASAAAMSSLEADTDLDAFVEQHGAPAVAELVEHDLVEVEGLARRDLLKRAAVVGGVVAAGSVVSVVAATPAFAASITPTVVVSPDPATVMPAGTLQTRTQAFTATTSPTAAAGTVAFSGAPKPNTGTTGTVTFIGSPAVDANGTATATASFSAAGMYIITATLTPTNTATYNVNSGTATANVS